MDLLVVIIGLFVVFRSFDDRPCLIIVFKMPWFNKPSMTRCLPMDTRLLKDHMKKQISGDVDHVEEISGAGLALNVVELSVLLFIIVAACVKSYTALQRSRMSNVSSPSIGAATIAPFFGSNATSNNASAAPPSIPNAASPLNSSSAQISNVGVAPMLSGAPPNSNVGVAHVPSGAPPNSNVGVAPVSSGAPPHSNVGVDRYFG